MFDAEADSGTSSSKCVKLDMKLNEIERETLGEGEEREGGREGERER